MATVLVPNSEPADAAASMHPHIEVDCGVEYNLVATDRPISPGPVAELAIARVSRLKAVGALGFTSNEINLLVHFTVGEMGKRSTVALEHATEIEEDDALVHEEGVKQ